MALPQGITKEFLDMTYPDQYYKSVIEPAKLGKGPVPGKIEMLSKSQPIKALGMQVQNLFSPGKYDAFRAAPTKAAATALGWGAKGLGYLASLPAQAALMTLHSTPANAAEVGMTAKDFQNLALQNQSKGPLYVDPNLSYEDFPLTEFEKELRYTPKGQREEIYNEMLGKLEGMTDVEKKDYLHYSPTDANLSGIPYDFEKVRALEYTDDPVFEDYYETGEHWSPGIPGIQRFKQQQLMNKKKQDMQQTIRQHEAAEKKRIEQEKIKTAQKNWKPTYNPASSHAEARSTGGDYHSGHQSTVGGQTTDWGDMSHMIARGGLAQHAPRYANGGLIDFFRYGGFI